MLAASLAALVFTYSLPSVVQADGEGVARPQLEGTHRPQLEDGRSHTAFSAIVTSNQNGVDVDISVRQTTSGGGANPAPPIPNAPPSDPPVQPRTWIDDLGIHSITPDGTRTDLTPPLIGLASQDAWHQAAQQHPNQTSYVLQVNGQFQGIVWLPSQAPPQVSMPAGNGASTDPRQVALDVLAHIPLPLVTVRMNPALGLVGLSSWYWVDGYDGSDITRSRGVTISPAAPGLPPTSFMVTVRIWPTSYDWDFGDGTMLPSHSLGERYPQQSDIQHDYGFSSLPFPSGFPVRLTIQFAAEYRVNGGGPQPLPGIRHTYESDYRVQELQPVLARG